MNLLLAYNKIVFCVCIMAASFSFYTAIGQGDFVMRLDSTGYPGRQMEIIEYLDDGRMLFHTREYDDNGSMSNYVDDRREFIYFDNEDLKFDITSRRNDDNSAWELQYRYEFTYDSFGNNLSYLFRSYDDGLMEWYEDPTFGEYRTYDSSNNLTQWEYWQTGGLGYYMASRIEYAYLSNGKISESTFTTFSSSDPDLLLSEELSVYSYPEPDSTSILIFQRESINDEFVLVGRRDERSEGQNTIEKIYLDFIDDEFIPTNRDLYFFSEQGFYGGFIRQDYVNGAWQLNFDNITEFDEFGNRITVTTSNFNAELGEPEITSIGTTQYNYQVLAENCMLPFFGHLSNNPPIHIKTSHLQLNYDDGELDYEREFNFYYSDIVLKTSNATRQSELTIYPNPSADEIYLLTPDIYTDLYVSIIDLNGRLVFHHFIEQNESIDIRSLSPGTYNCIISSEGKYLSEQFVVK